MKKVIQFNDVLGNTIQLRIVIDTFKQIEDKPCWIVESKKAFPQNIGWGCYYPLKGQYFNSEKNANDAIKKHLLKYAEIAKKLGKKFLYKEVIL